MPTNIDQQEVKPAFPGWPLTKVIYTITFVVAATYLIGWYATRTLSALIRAHDVFGIATASRTVLIVEPFSYVLVMGIAIAFFPPVGDLLVWKNEGDLHKNNIFTQVLWGLMGGALAVLLSAPLPLTSDSPGLDFVASFLSGSNSAHLFFPILFMLAVVVASCAEVFFRGVVFRALLAQSNIAAGTMASCLVSAYVWPLYSPMAGLILGVIACLLYYRTRTLLPSIMANMTLVILGQPGSAVFHHLFR